MSDTRQHIELAVAEAPLVADSAGADDSSGPSGSLERLGMDAETARGGGGVEQALMADLAEEWQEALRQLGEGRLVERFDQRGGKAGFRTSRPRSERLGAGSG